MTRFFSIFAVLAILGVCLPHRASAQWYGDSLHNTMLCDTIGQQDYPTATSDGNNGAIVVCINNVLDHPTERGVEFGFPNFTRVVYAGGGLFSSQEDVYNPARDAPAAVGAWLRAGGAMLADPLPMKHATT